MYRIALIIFSAFVGVHLIEISDIKPCRTSDNSCIAEITESFYKAAINGDPSQDIEVLDPLYQDRIEGKLARITYTLDNTTVVGFKQCHVTRSRLSLRRKLLRFRMECPYFHMSGLYEASGKLISVPIEGNGNYTFECKDYNIVIETDTKTIEEGGKKYLQLENPEVNADLRGGMVANLTNLFNGENDQLADAALKFANNNWRPVSKELHGPVFNENIKKIVQNLNKYLGTVPLDKIITK